jgi:hypothetical protein
VQPPAKRPANTAATAANANGTKIINVYFS